MTCFLIQTEMRGPSTPVSASWTTLPAHQEFDRNVIWNAKILPPAGAPINALIGASASRSAEVPHLCDLAIDRGAALHARATARAES